MDMSTNRLYLLWKKELIDLSRDHPTMRLFCLVPFALLAVEISAAMVIQSFVPILTPQTVQQLMLPNLNSIVIILGLVFSYTVAVDITVGEKERSTIETTLCGPLSLIEIVIGKALTILTVFCVGMLLFLVISALILLFVRATDSVRWALFSGLWSASLIAIISTQGFLNGIVLAFLQVAIGLNSKSVREASTAISCVIVIGYMLAGIPLPNATDSNWMRLFISAVPIANYNYIGTHLLNHNVPWVSLAIASTSTLVVCFLCILVSIVSLRKEGSLPRV